MRYTIVGKNSVDLKDNNYLSSGGEGRIYSQGGLAYKVYNDPQKMIPLGKIQELSVLTHPNIIKPEDVLIDSKNKPIGYTMRFVNDTYALCQLFTKSFRDRNKVTPEMILDVVRKLQEVVKHTHDKNILIVDLNELNFLISDDFKNLYAIDVDSYQTPSFHATALMESVRDRHTKGFSTLTDWFAFAIVSFQLFVGIHPYKGKHPVYKNIDDRMMNNISVLNKDVNIPAVCYPFSIIPSVYLDWYKAVLERGERVSPPTDLQAVANLVRTVKKISGSNNFDIQELGNFDGQILDVLFSSGLQIISTDKTIYMGRDKTSNPGKCVIVTTPKCNNVVAACIQHRTLKIFNATARENISLSIAAESIMESDNRIYTKSGTHILEIQFNNESIDGKSLIVTTSVVANVLERSTTMYEGVVFQNLLGAIWASIFPDTGYHVQVRMPELDDYKVLDAKYENGVLMVIGSKMQALGKAGTYDKLIFRFDDKQDFQSYDVRVINDITPSGLNFVVLDNGICVHLNDEENIEIFSKKKDSTGLNVIDDPEISGDILLFKNGTKVFFSKDNKLFSLTMRKK